AHGRAGQCGRWCGRWCGLAPRRRPAQPRPFTTADCSTIVVGVMAPRKPRAWSADEVGVPMRRPVRWWRRDRPRPVAGAGRHTAGEVAAIAVTVAVLAALVVLKVVTRPVWRASARTGMAACVTGRGPGGSADRLHLMGHLAGCVARPEPARTDYVELAVVALLVGLLVAEVRLLGRDVHRRR